MSNDIEPTTRRMRPPAEVLAGAAQALSAVVAAPYGAGVSDELLAIVHLRVSQINGCSPCVDAAAHAARQAGTTDERLATVSAWRDAPWFTPAERSVLALAEAATRLSDRPDPVPDDIWRDVADHFGERELAAIVLMCATANLMNRINVMTRQPAGEWDRR